MNAILTLVLVELGLGSIVESDVVDTVPIDMNRVQSLTSSQILCTIHKVLDWIATGRHSGAGRSSGDDCRSIDFGAVVGSIDCGWVDIIGEVASSVGARDLDSTLAPVAESSNQGWLCRYPEDLNRNGVGLETIRQS